MTVKDFVDVVGILLAERGEARIYVRLCEDAREGRMGFGAGQMDYGDLVSGRL